MSPTAVGSTRREDEQGFVAGAEALILGVLVFVFGTLVVLNGWRVVDAKFATSAAAREAVRTVVQAEPGIPLDVVGARASAAAEEALRAHGYEGESLTLEPVAPLAVARCEPVRIRASLEVRSALVPGVAGPATFTIGAEHEQVVDPYRSGFAGEADCDF